MEFVEVKYQRAWKGDFPENIFEWKEQTICLYKHLHHSMTRAVLDRWFYSLMNGLKVSEENIQQLSLQFSLKIIKDIRCGNLRCEVLELIITDTARILPK